VTDFSYSSLLPIGPDTTEYRLVTDDGVDVVRGPGGRQFLTVESEVLTLLTAEAMHDIAHFLRPAHLTQLRSIIDDPLSSGNDRFVALDLLRNANIAAGGVLPMCQDTGTAIVMGKRGRHVLTDGRDEQAIARGVYEAYTNLNLRYSQLAPITMWEERNTGTNLPAQIELYAEDPDGHPDAYKLLYMAKGGGSANKSYLYQETKALLNPTSLMRFLDEKLRLIGTSACPPYHLAVVIGGTSGEHALKTAKLASAKYLDHLPTSGSLLAHGFRDVELEAEVLELTRNFGIGAQFGGRYFCHDVRVVRLPRHGASCPVAIAVSCSADRQALAKITPSGIWLERLETDPARFLPDHTPESSEVVQVDLNRPMTVIREELSRYPVKTRLSLSGPLVVARDIAHAKIAALLDSGAAMPSYLRDHAVYYAGPAKTPEGYASGSFGPTTAGRMDSYVEKFQAAGGSLVMLAKGNRGKQVTEACARYGGFYLGSIGGPAARLAQDCIKKVEVLEYPELGMEAVWRIEVEDFPAFIVVDDKGNDFFAETSQPVLSITSRR
jgi:fumarate hydratase, class I